MQTVTFRCPHCNNLMAVGIELLGQQVRCPTCQQVVIAPVPTDPPPISDGSSQISLSETTKQEGHDSIFGEGDGEAVFGSAPPKVEVPASTNFAAYPPNIPNPSDVTIVDANVPAPSAAPAEGQAPPSVDAVTSPPLPAAVEIQSAGPAAVEAPQTLSAPTSDANASPWSTSVESVPESANDQPWASSSLEEMKSDQGTVNRPAVRQQSNFGNLLMTMLIPYAVFMTLVAGWLFHKWTSASNVGQEVFANIPDIMAQYDPATRKQLSRRIDGMPAVDGPLPNSLLVKLGDTLRIGDMEVTPEKIEQGPITIHTVSPTGVDLAQLKGEALILHLTIRNRSSDIYYQPTDPVFNRYFDPRGGNSKPYTHLVVGDKRFYGGPIDVLRMNAKQIKRQFVAGQDNDDRPLPPGEERQTIICSDTQDGSADAVKNYTGADPILWRVELRRGLIEFRGQDLSVCAVIGVQFTPADVHKAKH